jgi:hypothetical protein
MWIRSSLSYRCRALFVFAFPSPGRLPLRTLRTPSACNKKKKKRSAHSYMRTSTHVCASAPSFFFFFASDVPALLFFMPFVLSCVLKVVEVGGVGASSALLTLNPPSLSSLLSPLLSTPFFFLVNSSHFEVAGRRVRERERDTLQSTAHFSSYVFPLFFRVISI